MGKTCAKCGGTAFNKAGRCRACPASALTQSELIAQLTYEPETGMFRWRSGAGAYRKHVEGRVAGSMHHDGYRVIRVNGFGYSAHRLAWLYIYGEFPATDLDHINRNRDDNRISNLRLATDLTNSQNKARAKNNKSGARGVHWCKTYSKWRAVIRVNRKLIHIGRYDTVEQAKHAYLEAARHYHPFNSDLTEAAHG